jgi:hypothetical protein
MKSFLVRVALAAALLAWPGRFAVAQSVRGVVTDAASSPVAGVVVILLDSAAREVSRAYTNASGEYRIVAPRAGTYALRTLRIGFRPQTSALVSLSATDGVERAISLVSVPTGLDTMRAVGRSVCRMSERDSVAATWRVWEQVRAALAITQLTRSNRAMAATTISSNKTLEPVRRRVQSQEFDVRADFVSQPWRAATPAELRKSGYVIGDGMGPTTYHAPSIEALLADEFLEDHCLRLTTSRDPRVIGVEFEPNRDRREIPEIKGTVWLTRATSELKSLEFRYVNASKDIEGFGGGETEFVRMKNGMWAISSWNIRMPALALDADKPGSVPEVEAIRVVGGQLSLVTVGDANTRDTLWSLAPVALSGSVSDTAGTPLKGGTIELAGTPLRAAIDPQGRFTITGILPGIYTMKLRGVRDTTPLLQSPIKFADTTAALKILLPRSVISAADRPIPVGNTATFTGAVLVDSTNQPIIEAEIVISALGLAGRSDARGEFTLSGITPGIHGVVVRRVGFGPMTTTLEFPERQTVRRRILLQRLTVLDSVVTTATPDPMMLAFEEHRKRGFGVFVTRAELAKSEAFTLASVAQQLRGLAYARGQQGQMWPLGRSPFTSCPTIPAPDVNCIRRERILYVPDDSEARAGVRIGCYAEVWMDRILLNRGTPTEPFDINSISVGSIEAVEWFAGSSQVPPEYMTSTSSRCGVLIVHTRRFKK